MNAVSSAHAQPRPAEIASVSRRDVVAVEREAGLEAERVARAEAARRDAPCEDRVPELDRVIFRAAELDALLAGVAGARDHDLDPSSSPIAWVNAGASGSPSRSRACGP